MTAMHWLNRVVGKSARPADDRRPRRAKRSLLEFLEQRQMLSGSQIQVTNGNAFGPGSLAAAISQADSSPGSTISFAHGVTNVILGGSTLPAITANMTINGGKGVKITQNGTEPIFDITAGTVVLSGLSISGGNAGTGVGGAVYDDSSSTVTLQNDSFYNNTATFGGAVFGDLGAGPLVISCCTFSYNTASSGGAVAYQGTGTVSVAGSTFTHNTANDSAVTARSAGRSRSARSRRGRSRRATRHQAIPIDRHRNAQRQRLDVLVQPGRRGRRWNQLARRRRGRRRRDLRQSPDG